MSAGIIDSGVEWIGELPDEWGVDPLRYHAFASTRATVFDKECGSEYLALENIESMTGHLVGLDERPDSVDSTVSVFSENDVLFGKLRPYLAKVARPDFNGVCTTEMIVITPIDYDRDYLFWLLLNPGLIDVIAAESYGVKMPRTSWSQLGLKRFPVPPYREQRAIARYLNEVIAKYDYAIALIEQQISTLELHRRSLIQETITKGINPKVAMKDSGVEWIGDMPEHWEVKRLKYVCTTRNGLDYESSDVCGADDDAATLVFRSSNIVEGNLRVDGIDDVYVSKKVPEELRVHKGDLLIVRTNGSRDLVGKSALVGVEHEGVPGAFMLLCRSGMNDYLYWVLNSSLLSYYKNRFMSSTINQLSNATFSSLYVPICPDEDERNRIIDYLSIKVGEINETIGIKRRQLVVLGKRRQSLIYEYVTGKRRVPMEAKEW